MECDPRCSFADHPEVFFLLGSQRRAEWFGLIQQRYPKIDCVPKRKKNIHHKN